VPRTTGFGRLGSAPPPRNNAVSPDPQCPLWGLFATPRSNDSSWPISADPILAGVGQLRWRRWTVRLPRVVKCLAVCKTGPISHFVDRHTSIYRKWFRRPAFLCSAQSVRRNAAKPLATGCSRSHRRRNTARSAQVGARTFFGPIRTRVQLASLPGEHANKRSFSCAASPMSNCSAT